MNKNRVKIAISYGETMKTFSRQFNSRFVTFFTGVLFALAAFFTFSCTLQNEEPKSSVGFNLQPGFLRSVAGEATGESGETGKIDLKAEISGNLPPPSILRLKNLGQFQTKQ